MHVFFLFHTNAEAFFHFTHTTEETKTTKRTPSDTNIPSHPLLSNTVSNPIFLNLWKALCQPCFWCPLNLPFQSFEFDSFMLKEVSSFSILQFLRLKSGKDSQPWHSHHTLCIMILHVISSLYCKLVKLHMGLFGMTFDLNVCKKSYLHCLLGPYH